MKASIIVSFAVGCAILITAFLMAFAGWWEADYIIITQILLASLALIVAFLTVAGIISQNKTRWTALLFTAILLLGFSPLAIASIGLLTAPIGLILLGFSVGKLAANARARRQSPQN